MLDNEKMVTSTQIESKNIFKQDGIVLKNAFVSKQNIQSLKEEITLYFSKPSFNGSNNSIELQYGLKTLPMPSIRVMSVNLLEIALDVRDCVSELVENFQSEFKLTSIEVLSDENLNSPLFWHRDSIAGSIRAMIYINGGDNEKAGIFEYVKGSHEKYLHLKHKIPADIIEENKDNIFSCKAGPGSLIIFNVLGIHRKTVCVENRKVIMFEFQKPEFPWTKADILISSQHLTPRVIENITFFQNGNPKGACAYGIERFYNEPTPFSLSTASKILLNSINYFLKSGIKSWLKRFITTKLARPEM